MLTLLLLTPLIGIFSVLLISSSSLHSIIFIHNKDLLVKQVGLLFTIITFLLSLIVWGEFDNNDLYFQFVEHYNPLYFFQFNIGIDGISLYFVVLTAIIIPVCILCSWSNIKEGVTYYIVCFLLLELLLIAVFVVLDLLLFYVLFESVLPPLFIIIGVWGHGINKIRASFLLFLYTLFGSLFMLLSILVMYYIVGNSSFHLLFLTELNLDTQKLLFIGFFIALAIKTPLLPFHIWLYRAHAEAPLAGSVLLAGVILKMATYGYIRILLTMLPEATYYFTPFVQTLAVVTIIYSSLTTLRQNDIKALVAYSSVAHMGTVVLALFSNNIQAIEGGIMLSIAHGLVSPALFICVGGILYDRYHTRLIKYYRGIAMTMPLFSTLFLLFTLSNIAVPLSANFVGEFMSLNGAFQKNPMLTLFASTGVVLSACYSIWVYNKMNFGSQSLYLVVTQDINRREFFLLIPLLILTFVLGIYPNIVLDTLHLSVSNIIYISDNIEHFILLPFILNKYKTKLIYKGVKWAAISILLSSSESIDTNELLNSTSTDTDQNLDENKMSSDLNKEEENKEEMSKDDLFTESKQNNRYTEDKEKFVGSTGEFINKVIGVAVGPVLGIAGATVAGVSGQGVAGTVIGAVSGYVGGRITEETARRHKFGDTVASGIAELIPEGTYEDIPKSPSEYGSDNFSNLSIIPEDFTNYLSSMFKLIKIEEGFSAHSTLILIIENIEGFLEIATVSLFALIVSLIIISIIIIVNTINVSKYTNNWFILKIYTIYKNISLYRSLFFIGAVIFFLAALAIVLFSLYDDIRMIRELLPFIQNKH